MDCSSTKLSFFATKLKICAFLHRLLHVFWIYRGIHVQPPLFITTATDINKYALLPISQCLLPWRFIYWKSAKHTDNVKKCGVQKIADTLCTRMLGKSPVCQNSGVGKKGEMLESCQHHQQRAKSRFPIEGKKIFPADVLRAFDNTQTRSSTRKNCLFRDWVQWESNPRPTA